MNLDRAALFQIILPFLTKIGIDYQFTTIDKKTFLPGLEIENGTLLIDKEKCLYLGDILHEAGHIAVLTKEERRTTNGDLGDNGTEIGVMLWSFAASNFLNLPLEIVFHDTGYKGDAEWMRNNFQNKIYIGLPLLQYYGMCYDEKNAIENNTPPFPYMMNWLRT